jgi:hypothetical protein
MIELFSKTDYISKVSDSKICEYLSNSFNRYPDNFNFKKESSFIVIDDIEELNEPIKLYNGNIIPPISDDSFQDMITMIDGDEFIVDIVLLFSDAGNGASIVINKECLSMKLLDILVGNNLVLSEI